MEQRYPERRPMTPSERAAARKRAARRRKQRRIKRFLRFCFVALIGVTIFVICRKTIPIIKRLFVTSPAASQKALDEGALDIVQDFLTPNPYSRPQEELKEIKNVVVHYTANPGTDAQANRNYFESLKDSGATYASSHFVIGLDGTIIQCIPLNEISYASNERNVDSISIECCHPDETGKFNKKTYDSLIQLTAWLADEYNLSEKQIIRHYDVKGKACPLYFVEHEDAWEQFKKDVFAYKKKKGK
ncbi:peptidoglycan recognition family protein [Anaerolentibacter hominis]|uniref:peptidoglycan recognition protein family protein n=1 Tax=Anaerolentibacter hominis TaxID=3079009 RepID=UPI0031B82A0F